METINKARNGVWTPWSQVLCFECDYRAMTYGANVQRASVYSKHYASLVRMGNQRTALVEQPEGELVAQCNDCRCPCWVRADVALCQKVGFKFAEVTWDDDSVGAGFALQQTGGMCCAGVFSITDDNDVVQREIVVTAMDGTFFVGVYARTDEPTNEPIEWTDSLCTWESGSYLGPERFEYLPQEKLNALIEKCASKVIEYVQTASKELVS